MKTKDYKYLPICVKYANDLITGNIPASNITKLCAKRFLNDIERKDLYIDETLMDRMVIFFSMLELPEQKTKKYFIPESWQYFLLFNTFCFYRTSNHKRKTQNVFLQIARKNGKSVLICSIILFFLVFGKDEQVIAGANSKNQIKDVDKRLIKLLADSIDPQQEYIQTRLNKVQCYSNELIFVASDTTKLDGLSCSFACIEEPHEMKTSAMFDILRSSQGARENPLMMMVTTAGFSVESFGYKQYDYYKNVLNGVYNDDDCFGLIYEIDKADIDNLTDENVIIKSNPNLGVTVSKDFILSEVNRTKNNTSDLASVLTKNFNYYLESRTLNQWIENSYIKKVLKKVDLNAIDPAEYLFYVGVDLGSTDDLTAVSLLAINDDNILVKNYYYVPEDSLNTHENKEFYKRCLLNNEITITPGNVCDYSYILNDILKLNKKLPIQTVFYDAWNSTSFIIDMTESGFNCQPFSQSTQSINRPFKELKRLILSNKVTIDNNSLTEWCLNNTQAKEIGTNERPEKVRKSKKIDGLMAILTGFGGYLTTPNYQFNVW